MQAPHESGRPTRQLPAGRAASASAAGAAPRVTRARSPQEIVNKYRAAGVALFDAEHAPAHYHEHFAGDDHLSSRQPDDAIHHHQVRCAGPAPVARGGVACAGAAAYQQRRPR